MVTLCVFILSQSIISGFDQSNLTRLITFIGRAFIYLLSMGTMIFNHMGSTTRGYRKKDTITIFGYIKLPKYLENWQQSANLVLTICLIIMLASEPILHCLSEDGGQLFNDVCPAVKDTKFFPYSVFTMFAMMLYYILLIDLAVFNNRVSAYVLVCGRMLAELGLFLLALAAVLLTLSSSLSCLEQTQEEFKSIGTASLALWEMILGMYSQADFTRLHDEPVILVGVYGYLVLGMVFLLNLLVAQLTCAYNAIYTDMVGYARLKRVRIVCDTMPSVKLKKFERFVDSLELAKRIEFNEGDVGVSGGIQLQEPSSQNPTTTDTIKRFGGSTSPTIKWPEEEGGGDDDSDRFQRLEDLIKKVGDEISKSSHGVKKVRGGASSSGMSGSGGGAGGSAEAGQDHGSGAEGSGAEAGEEDAEE
jgi:hypothetical protein